MGISKQAVHKISIPALAKLKDKLSGSDVPVWTPKDF
jgi:hypothetical protein